MGRFSRVSPALVVSCLALSISFGGVGWAATVLPKGSVGTAQLKKDAVTTQKVKNASLLAADFKLGQIPTGPAGPPGIQGTQGGKGDKGEKGDKGDIGATGLSGYEIVTASNSVNAYYNLAFVQCPSGKRALGGGSSSSPLTPEGAFVSDNFPTLNGTGWRAVTARSSAGASTLTVYAICAIVS